MRKLLFSFLVFCAALSLSKRADAQWVTIPDANFVTWLTANYPTCMSGNQMDTTCSGIISPAQVYCHNQNIHDLTGIQYFDNDTLLWCGWNHISSFPTMPHSLREIHCEYDSMTSLTNLPSSLRILRCQNNQLTSITNLPNQLINLHCENNLISTVANLPNSLQAITINNNLLSTIGSFPNGLLVIYCVNNLLTSITSLPNSLKQLYCSNNLLNSLPSLPNSLTIINCDNNLLTSLPELPDSVYTLNCSNNLSLTCLPALKKIYQLNFQNTGVSCIPNYPIFFGTSSPQITSLPLCNFYNNSGCPVFWNITGSAYQDTSNDCIQQSNENSFNQVKINLKQGGNLLQQQISNTGLYSFDTYLNTYQVEIDTTNFPFITNCFSNGSNDTTVNVTPLDSLIYGIDFGMHCKPGFDIGVNGFPNDSGFFIPNTFCSTLIFAGDMSNFYGAHCAAGVGGSVVATFSGPVTYAGHIAGALAPTTVIGNTVTWNIADFGNVNFISDFHLRFHTDSSAQINQQVCCTILVSPSTGDNDILNNTKTMCAPINSSFDPNEKEVSPIGNIDSTQKWLTYTIHFQNTGTATAQHIYVDDTLDSDLDESSFQLLAYSVAPFVQIKGNAVRFNFPNINLPDSNANEPGSHGYVQYRIKPKHNLAVGTQIQNTGFIYFDFNPPVVTNTTLNVVTLPNDVNQFQVSSFKFQVFPNPAGEKLMVNGLIVNGQETKISITDLFGKEIQSISTTKSSYEFNIANLSSGIYFVTVKSKNGFATEKFVKE